MTRDTWQGTTAWRRSMWRRTAWGGSTAARCSTPCATQGSGPPAPGTRGILSTGKYHEIIISIMLQMEMAFLVSIHILCRTFQTNVPFSNESWVNKRNITFFASKPFLWQLCNIILKVSFYIPPDRDLWYCFTKFLYLRKKSVMNSNA